MKTSLMAKLFLILVVIGLWLFATHPAWVYHLRVDIDGQYLGNARTFLRDHNLAHQSYNEYQPGAVIFFLLLSPILLIKDTNNAYLLALFSINTILIFILGGIFKKISGYLGLLSFALILLFTGPIIFYRFELYVSLFVILSIWSWQKSHKLLSLAILAFATVIKIYPALLLPYFLITALKKRDYKTLVVGPLVFLASIFFVIAGYLYVFQVPPGKIIGDLSIHSRKPVHAESVWGTLLTITSKITTGEYALGKGDVGIFGIAKEYVIGPMAFYNYFWVVVLIGIYLWLLFRSSKSGLNANICLLILLAFLVFSKILTAQYLIWFALIFPLTKLPTNPSQQTSWFINLSLIVLISFLSQYIYPLKYNELLGGFYANGSFVEIFWTLALRNALLLFLFFRYLKTSLCQS